MNRRAGAISPLSLIARLLRSRVGEVAQHEVGLQCADLIKPAAGMPKFAEVAAAFLQLNDLLWPTHHRVMRLAALRNLQKIPHRGVGCGRNG